MIEILTPGALTTVQDLGRPGLGASGVPPSGAFDRFALRIGNLLVANPQDAASLECTLHGPTIRFEQETVVALTGSRFDAKLDDEPVPWEHAFVARAGSTLSVKRTHEGARCYIAMSGGITLEPILGSRSTHLAAQLGHPPVGQGDRLPVGERKDGPLRKLARAIVSPYARAATVRAISLGDERLFDAPYTVSARADRTGVRLEGAELEGGEVDPEAVPEGAVQIPPDGRPIALGPDRPITGGYPKVAAVIAADLGVIAQAKPGDTLRFMRATVEDARAIWLSRERELLEAIEDSA